MVVYNTEFEKELNSTAFVLQINFEKHMPLTYSIKKSDNGNTYEESVKLLGCW